MQGVYERIPTFEKWLKKQKHRLDPIGRLARDFIIDESACWWVRTKLPKVSLEYLLKLSSDPEILKTYEKCLIEYKKFLQLKTKKKGKSKL